MRLSLGGGGTDIPEFYSKHEGFWVSTAVNKFVYVGIKSRFEKEIRLVYSRIEDNINSLDDIKHGFMRVALERFNVRDHVEITTLSDLPSGSGMGSSGSFAVGLINALSIYTCQPVIDMAELAFKLDRELGNPVGKQDQYTALFGGVRIYTARKNGVVTNMKLDVPGLSDRLSLFYTGITRDANPILKVVADSEESMLQIQEIGKRSFEALDSQDYDEFGKLLDEHWKVKQSISPMMSNNKIDYAYLQAKNAGSLGGKLCGSGGGGFLLFYSSNEKVKAKLMSAMNTIGFPYVPFEFYREGSKVIEI